MRNFIFVTSSVYILLLAVLNLISGCQPNSNPAEKYAYPKNQRGPSPNHEVKTINQYSETGSYSVAATYPFFENLENKASFANLNGEFYKYAQEEVKRFKIKCLDSNSKGNDLNLHYDLYTIGDSLLIIEWIYHIKMDNQPEQVQRVAYKYDLKTGKNLGKPEQPNN
ncbi:MAG: hypothetical protein IPI59_14510 [Sphingobacteriales bacterium]|jgi:hypothetical protein|nr:hypothetical protein [Sphingobacteriales bacterium]MBP9142749.1 hypothetical protein [Chitinophagales bacterium]MDA0199908.1 hypothetical protein [Bacteroidota bacterium]MBK6888773.1 hypothetical protein [Sphingobacteriales bacterium]MBK7528720.1 hypothetical protein [Sphingobacteriales bacterium]